MKREDYCGYCDDFPCDKVNTKLINSHIGQPAFKYRHEIPKDMKAIKQFGIDKFIALKSREYTCPACQGKIHFYTYICSKCGSSALNNCQQQF
jgi:hypothetical protein